MSVTLSLSQAVYAAKHTTEPSPLNYLNLMKILLSVPQMTRNLTLFEEIKLQLFVSELEQSPDVKQIALVANEPSVFKSLRKNTSKTRVQEQKQTQFQNNDPTDEFSPSQNHGDLSIIWCPLTVSAISNITRNDIIKRIQVAFSNNLRPSLVLNVSEQKEELYEALKIDLNIPLFNHRVTATTNDLNHILPEKPRRILIFMPLHIVKQRVQEKSKTKLIFLLKQLDAITEPLECIEIVTSTKKEQEELENLTSNLTLNKPIFILERRDAIRSNFNSSRYRSVISFDPDCQDLTPLDKNEMIIISRKYDNLKIRRSNQETIDSVFIKIAREIINKDSYSEDIIVPNENVETSINDIIRQPLNRPSTHQIEQARRYITDLSEESSETNNPRNTKNMKTTFKLFSGLSDYLKTITHRHILIATCCVTASRSARLLAYLLPMYLLTQVVSHTFGNQHSEATFSSIDLDFIRIIGCTVLAMIVMWLMETYTTKIRHRIDTNSKGNLTAHQIQSVITINGNNLFFLVLIFGVFLFDALIGFMLFVFSFTIYLTTEISIILSERSALSQNTKKPKIILSIEIISQITSLLFALTLANFALTNQYNAPGDLSLIILTFFGGRQALMAFRDSLKKTVYSIRFNPNFDKKSAQKTK